MSRRRRLLKVSFRLPLSRSGDQGGFTMLEALVGVAIMAMVATVMAAGVAMAFRAVHFQRSGGIAVDEGRRIMPQIAQDLKVSRESNLTPDVERSLDVDGDLVLTHVNPDNGSPFTVTYSLDGSNLIRTQQSAGSRTMARNVVDAVFMFCETDTEPECDGARYYNVTLITAGPDTDRSRAENPWRVYQRIDP
jgi:hypothetical protein